MASEVAMAYAWVDSTLRADSALMAVATGVWQGAADIGAQPPFVVYAKQADSDVVTLAAVRLWASIVLQIKAVGLVANYAALALMADRIDELFKNQSNITLPQGGMLKSRREQQLAMDEPLVAGARWTNLGGFYRIDIQGQ